MIFESGLDIIMGCGHPLYDPNGKEKSLPNTYKYVADKSTWEEPAAGTAGNDADNGGNFDAWTLIQNRADFQYF